MLTVLPAKSYSDVVFGYICKDIYLYTSLELTQIDRSLVY